MYNGMCGSTALNNAIASSTHLHTQILTRAHRTRTTTHTTNTQAPKYTSMHLIKPNNALNEAKWSSTHTQAQTQTHTHKHTQAPELYFGSSDKSQQCWHRHTGTQQRHTAVHLIEPNNAGLERGNIEQHALATTGSIRNRKTYRENHA